LAASNCRYGRKIPASNYLIRPENLAASNCRYGWKIQASNYQIRPDNSASGNYRNSRKIPASIRLNVIVLHIQGCSGAVVEHLVHNLKAYPVLKYFSITPPENSVGAENSPENSGSHAKNFFCSMYEMSQRHPVWVAENHVNPCNSVEVFFCLHTVYTVEYTLLQDL
jgi:hypothetical protein